MKVNWKPLIIGGALAGASWCSQGCDDGSHSRIGELEAQVNTLEQESEDLQAKLDNAKSAADEVRSEYDSLSRSIRDFSDGITNWRDVVDDVESKSRAVDDALMELETKF
jgi:uncharacterized coiled-coil DUF342 family protein